jgi:hypothetical protein
LTRANCRRNKTEQNQKLGRKNREFEHVTGLIALLADRYVDTVIILIIHTNNVVLQNMWVFELLPTLFCIYTEFHFTLFMLEVSCL